MVQLSRTFYPSQVVELIATLYPFVRTRGAAPIVGSNDAAAVRAIVQAIEALPDHLITLDANEYGQFIVCRAELEWKLDLWASGNIQMPQVAVPNGLRPRRHPIKALYELLSTCSDLGAPEADARLAFLDDAFREILARDVAEMERCFDAGSWKACTVMAGSIIEALVLWAVQRAGEEVGVREGLTRLLQRARERGIVSESTFGVVSSVRDFRNGVHPGREQRDRDIVFDRPTAMIAVGAVNKVIDAVTP